MKIRERVERRGRQEKEKSCVMLICGGNGEDGADLAGEDGSRRRGHRAPAGFERWRSLTENGPKGWMMDLKTGKGGWLRVVGWIRSRKIPRGD